MTGRRRAGSVSLLLQIECRDGEVASALDAALMPDNRYFPKDQRFSASRRGRRLTFRVDSPRLRPAVSTVESIIADAKLFGEVWSQASRR
ncbi:MAG: hypothetical protein JRN23_00825 [Nitrososphaerota archaeon]|nr:hypothetical protein [Nitrososphaerota archaeon]